MNWWLIVVACLVSLVLLFLSVWFIVYFIAENDRQAAWFPKAIAAVGLCLAMVTVLLLPFDVANRRDPTSMESFGGGLDTVKMWMICLWTVASFVIVIIPFTTFFYEAYDPDQTNVMQQVGPALTYTFAFVLVFGSICAILWVTVGYATIPYFSYNTAPQFYDPFDARLRYVQLKSVAKLEISVSIFVYVVALLAAIGWLFFCVFGGVGLTALPIEIMSDWMSRPKPISAQQYSSERERIASRAGKLLVTGKKLDKLQRTKSNNSTRRKINAFKAEVLSLEKEFNTMEIGYKEQGISPFLVAGWFILGCVSAMLSLLWIMHIFLWNAIQLNPFLNTFLLDLDSAFGLFAVVAYGIFAFYLLWCAVKGCVKVGMRILFFQIHPLRKGDTLMNSMLFNIGLILLCSVTVTQFCALSFRAYASNTAVDTLLNTYVRRLKGLGTIIVWFQVAFVCVALLSVFWLILCPRKKVEEEKDDDDD